MGKLYKASVRPKSVHRVGNAVGANAVKGPEPRAPEREIPRPLGAGVGARPRPPFWDVSGLAGLTVKALRGDREALKALLDRVAGARAR